jgi:hypothetical protein
VGGGGSTNDTAPGQGLLASVPVENHTTTDVAETGDTPTGWYIEWEDVSGSNTASVYAVCAP